VVCSQREFEITFVVFPVRKSLKAAVKSNESHQQDVSYCYSLDQSQFSWIINMQACFPSVLKVLLNPDSTDFVVLLQLMRLLWADSEIVGGTVAQISGGVFGHHVITECRLFFSSSQVDIIVVITNAASIVLQPRVRSTCFCRHRRLSCLSEIQIGFTFLVLVYLDSPGKGPLNGCCCC